MQLPPVGTIDLLRLLSPYIPDDIINQCLPRQRREGRRLRFSSAQLWRVHLLVLITRSFSFNALLRSLPEQEQWRRFAHLPNRFAIPDVRMLSDFRRAVGAAGFRQINDHLLGKILLVAPLNERTVAFIDATDLPASTEDKKNKPATGPRAGRRSVLVPSARAKLAFLSVTKSTRCGSGSVGTSHPFFSRPWSPGSRRPTCLRAIC